MMKKFPWRNTSGGCLKNLFEKTSRYETAGNPSKTAKDYSGKEKINEQLTEAMLQSKTCNI
jgi:hypothetical protein